MLYEVVDWGDDAYRTNGEAKVVETVDLPNGLTGFCYDGGRLDLDGYNKTIYLMTHQFSVRQKED